MTSLLLWSVVGKQILIMQAGIIGPIKKKQQKPIIGNNGKGLARQGDEKYL